MPRKKGHARRSPIGIRGMAETQRLEALFDAINRDLNLATQAAVNAVENLSPIGDKLPVKSVNGSQIDQALAEKQS